MVPRATIDFETRSACSLKNCGAWRYSIDPSTEVLCLAFRLPSWAPGRTALWHPAFPQLDLDEADVFPDIADLINWIMDGGLVEAHNVWFEYCIWNNILIPRFAWPAIALTQWRCSAAKASASAIPRHLDDALSALQLSIRKDMDGHKLMMKVSRPRKSWKKERDLWAETGQKEPALLWHETREQFERLWAYCRQDVLAEEALSEALPDLSRHETELFLLDLAINARGFQLDKQVIPLALKRIATETLALNKQLTKLTRGQVKRATQRAQMLQWFQSKGLWIYDTQKETLDNLDPYGPLDPLVQQAVGIVRSLGRSSTAKYQAMQNWADPRDWRVRGGLRYHGATTGRWAGVGVQPHNFPKGSIKDQDALWESVRSGAPVQDAKGKTLDTMEALANGLRGAICASPGRQLYVADYAAIEARVVLWLAGDESALDIFRRGEDIYCAMAAGIYSRPVTKSDAVERGLGKIAILGLGYQMGAAKFLATCAKFGIVIDDALAQHVVTVYRESHPLVQQLWWDTEAAAIEAVRSGKAVQCGYAGWHVYRSVLYCTLPSGRRLAYPFPQVKQRETPWGLMKDSLTFKGVNPYNRQWQRQTTYGGCLVENITQAVARDIMADAMLRCEASGVYDLVLSVHDELVAEADLGAGSVKEFEALLTKLPTWATGCPIEAEGWSGTRYRK